MTNTAFSHFTYQNNKLFCEGVDIELLAQKQGSPLYVYSYQSLCDQYDQLASAFAGIDHLICYATKANTNKAILKTFFDRGAGADVVSGGEMRRAIAAGCDPKKIVYSGVGKTNEELHYALGEGVLQINVECEQELENIQRIAKFLGKRAPVAIRVNPDVDPKTHPYISTGLKEEKFGVSMETAMRLYRRTKELDHVDAVGIHCHIGSQILETSPFFEAFGKITAMVKALKAEGIELQNIDIGGGFGIFYQEGDNVPSPEIYAKAFLEPVKELNARILIEPGRYLVGNAGALITKVNYGKKSDDGKIFVMVDAGMADLIRPMLYQAHHEILPVQKFEDREEIVADIVGPYCESTDTLAPKRKIQTPAQGEYLAVMSAGAYGMSMASLYNSRGRPAEVLIKDNMFYVIKRPDRLEDFTKQECLPEFLKDRD